MEFDLVNGTKYEPDYKDEQPNKHGHGDDDFEEEGQETAAATVRTTARAVVVLRRWDWWTIRGPIQMSLFLCHYRAVLVGQKTKGE